MIDSVASCIDLLNSFNELAPACISPRTGTLHIPELSNTEFRFGTLSSFNKSACTLATSAFKRSDGFVFAISAIYFSYAIIVLGGIGKSGINGGDIAIYAATFSAKYFGPAAKITPISPNPGIFGIFGI